MNRDITVKRHPERGKYDTESLFSILDEAVTCHVAFSIGSVPYNIPMIHVRSGLDLFVHSSIKSRFYQELSSGIESCLTVTIVDGLVLAKSVYNSSLNYRSAMIFGHMLPVLGNDEKLEVAEKLTEKISPGRWSDCRIPSSGELKATGFLKIPLDTFSVKVRTGPPMDNPEDETLPYWSGIIPMSVVKGEPETAPRDEGRITKPAYL